MNLTALTLPWPANWSEVFGVSRPLIVEIGFGNGDYLIHLAENHPECHIIGFEISGTSIEKANKKIQSKQLDNACVVFSRGETALHHLFTPESVREFHINYPDPWFKKRHAGRRLMQRDTLDAIISRLEPDGVLYLATDVRDYADMSHELLSETPGLINTLNQPWVNEMPGRIVTKYEARGYRLGSPGHFFRYQRNDVPAPDIPVITELTMPHVVLRTPVSPMEIVTQFEKMTVDTGDDIHVTVLSSYVNPQRDTVLFEVIVVEPTIEQHIALSMNLRADSDDYVLRYMTLGIPRMTSGLHRATGIIADWVVGLHPNSEILGRKISE